MNETLFQIAFSRLKGMNITVARLLLKEMGSVERFFAAPEKEINDLLSLKRHIFSQENKDIALSQAAEELAFAQKGQVKPLFFTNPDYPARLQECSDAPLLLYYRGEAQLNAKYVISIVGTRNATNYGKDFCASLVQDLSNILPNPLIVSGLAYGIDIAAHRTAMQYNLPTVAVLAHGLNTIYPASHRNAAVQLLEHGGGLITEYHSQTNMNKAYFVARNRIVAGMADATLVIESDTRGGSLITAEIANGYNRDVFALPGRVTDRLSNGCNKLIERNKAAALLSAEEFVDAMCWEKRNAAPQQQQLSFEALDPEEEAIYALLNQQGESHLNEISIATNIPIAKVISSLMELEFKSLVKAIPGGKYRIKN